MKFYLSTCAWRDMDIETIMPIFKAERNPKYQMYWSARKGDALIGRTRSIEATKFLDNPAFGDIYFSLDSDIKFTPEDMFLLVQDVAEGMDIVGGVYVTRDPESPRPAIRMPDGTKITIGEGSPVPAIYVSTGFMAVHRRVFEAMAKTLPFCRSGNTIGFYPFFHPAPFQHPNGGWEYLSEDWHFCCRAATDLGFKVWADPRPKLGHLGMRTYYCDDIKTGDLSDSYTVVTEGSVDKTNIVRDLSTFLNKSISDVWKELGSLPENATALEWNQVAPTTPEAVHNFYCNSQSYLMALARFNLRADYWCRVANLLECGGSIADFGGGIGTLAIYLTHQCNKVHYIELPSPHRKFAEYRFSKLAEEQGKRLRVASNLEGLFNLDSVLAADVLEHIHPNELPKVVASIAKSLKKGGSLLAMCDFGKSDLHPMHFATKEMFELAMTAEGFIGGPVKWTKS